MRFGTTLKEGNVEKNCILGLLISLFVILLVFFASTCDCSEEIIHVLIPFYLVTRVLGIICLSILIHFLRISAAIVNENQSKLESYKQGFFVKCTDGLSNLDTSLFTQRQDPFSLINIQFYSSIFVLGYICLEILAAGYLLFEKSGHRRRIKHSLVY